MKKQITRRDFLKLAGLLPLSVATPHLLGTLNTQQEQQNVLIIVFDAFSAHNISLYGYQRETTPNISRWAERAVVYHNHYAGGNYTTPGTASLLTGTFPWTHRALGTDHVIGKNLSGKNIFSAFQNYYRLAYTHNQLANSLLLHFSEYLSNHVPLGELYLVSDDFIYNLFETDGDTAVISWARAMKKKEEGYSYSLFLAHLLEKQRERILSDLRFEYPGGVPYTTAEDYFLLEDAINWLVTTLGGLSRPFMGYFHFWPPHAPYYTHREFFDYFDGDGYWPVMKPLDRFKKNKDSNFEHMVRQRTNYDEYILNVDREFGRLMDKMDASGLLNDTWVILTSDHGEMFERGIRGHWTSVLYQPVIHIPLMIFEPGRKNRTDIYSNTSAVDVLPTLLHVTGQRSADWSEGSILPPFGPQLNPERNLYVVQARNNKQYQPLTVATTALIKGQHKLMYFFGYEKLDAGNERVELYDIENDPEELNDLSSSKRETTAELLNELKEKLAEVNEPYL